MNPTFVRFGVALVVVTACCHSASSGEAVRPALPISDAAVARVKTLKPNEAAILGKAKVVGEFNDVARKYSLDKTGPTARDFTLRMVWAPERKRALFCGANHAVPHRLNDVWEFDLSAMTWAMLYAPDNPRDYTGLGKDASDVELRDGVFITKRGGPGIIGHTWWGLTYDPVRKEMLFLNTWVTEQKKAAERIGGDPATLYDGPPLWAFSPQKGAWRPIHTEKPYPRAIFGGMLEYVPELAGAVWHANNWQMQATWLYDPKSNLWRNLQANGGGKAFETNAAQPEQVGYLDPKRRMFIVHRHKDTHHFGIARNAWKKVRSADKDAADTPYGHDAYAPMDYDSVSGHGLLVEFRTNKIWAYDPDKTTWTLLAPTGDPMPEKGRRLAYFDHALGVFVIIRDTTVWAYRYR